ncbi:ABC transporter ATP-binding protein [Paraburkholderia sp. Ac-20342]|uniref:ABC transporter ATP-binding protein n=1 Tax=Paraburkholderia sp. Ac-20342 TaxID=2703889 RepID=UPI00198001B3|nr:ABC transporter ATP-binding protein [Paraburkholderia sp. Ac-20342]MBN3849308.1 ABC transporter ATP-binding protein [Paraburkholderia sp. Ac-20342]
MSQPLKIDDGRRPLELVPGQRAAAPQTREVAICVDQVSKRFGSKRGDVQAVSDASLTIGRGEFVSIVGPSGCGKSTLLNMIAGLMPVSDGRIDVFGKPVTGPVHELGVVFQQHLLLPWRTILSNVLLQIEVRKLDRAEYLPRARQLLQRVGLGDFIDRFPDELSGGMNQRAAIVRGLVHDPDVLLMDEPFGALDAMTRDQMCLDFHQLSREQGKTVLFITHSISEAVFLSNRVVVMSPRPGRIEEIVPIELDGERHVDMRDEAEFTRYTRHIRRTFERMGVLKEERRR